MEHDHQHADVASLPADLLTARSGRVKAARRLARRVSRQELGLFLAEGSKALTEALAVDDCVVEVFATEAATADQAVLRERVRDAGLPWQLCADNALEALAGTVAPQGIVAVCRHVHRSLDAILTGAEEPTVVEEGVSGPSPTVVEEGASARLRTVVEEGAAAPLRTVVEEGALAPVSKPRTLAICADVRDPGNAGTILRTADAAGTSGVVLAGNSVDPYNDKVVRSTVGSLFHVPFAIADDPADVVRAAQDAGYVVLAADGGGEVDLFGAGDLLRGKVAWLFGNEAWGLPAELAASADHRVAIPILGRAESLNLATAAALCLYESARVARGGTTLGP